MKTNSSYSLVLFQPGQHNLKGGGGSVLAPSFVLTTAVVALLLMATCTTTNAASKVAGGVAPLADDLRFQLGKVALAPDPRPARFSFDKADGQIADAGDWAGTAAGNMLATSAPDLFPKEVEGVGALVQAPVQVGAFLLTPGAAVKGAAGTRKQPELHLRKRERRSRRCDPIVTAERQLESAAHRGTADGKPLHIWLSDVAVKLAGSGKWMNAQ